MKADGTIVLTHTFKDVRDAIDTAAGSVLSDASTLYPTKTVVNQLRTSDRNTERNRNAGLYFTQTRINQLRTSDRNTSDAKYIKNNEKIGIRFDPSYGPGAQRYLAPHEGNTNYRLWWNNDNFKKWRIVK